MTELKPCPFCGSPVHWDERFGYIRHNEARRCFLMCQDVPKGPVIREYHEQLWNERNCE